MIVDLVPLGARVLDVGCGSGTIASMMTQARAAHVVGIEPHPARASEARRSGVEVLEIPFDAAHLAGFERFDVVVFADVLEHLVTPADALQLAKSLLRPGGCIIVSVPNVAHWTVRVDLLRGRFEYREFGIMDATHLRWFTRKSLAQLIEITGFHIDTLAGSAGLWMSDYSSRPPWRWMSRKKRRQVVLFGLREWPELFSCQYILKASPDQGG